jgi:alpha-N-arabinofuranosidase
MNFSTRSALAAGLLAAAFDCAAQPVQIRIDAGKPGPVIDRHVYGQFAEHLGAGIYGGIWVGPDSPIPNTRGWRNDVVAALKQLHVPVVRWPGGCFADQYHWRDGIGARASRPVRINANWGGVEESNAVGTHEFFDLTEQIGADAYVSGNLGSGTVQEMSEWVEYLTARGGSSLAQLRAANGHPEPFKLAFFGVGNEPWGCGGNLSVEQYAGMYKQYATFLRPGSGTTQFIAAGGHDGDTSWSDYLSAHLGGGDQFSASGITFHYYTSPAADSHGKHPATGFGEAEWISTLQQTQRMQGFITSNVAEMDKHDPKQKLGFLVDEWGTWYDSEPGTNGSFLLQQNSLRDALVAALNFNIFHAHADRVRMANIAQMVNVLQAMILTDKDKAILTPTYHAFRMYVPFQDATVLPVAIERNPPYAFGASSIPTLSVSAARGKDGKLYLALVNTNPNAAVEVAVGVDGRQAASADGTVLTAARMDMHNNATHPEAVAPRPFHAALRGGSLAASVPAKAIVVLAIEVNPKN